MSVHLRMGRAIVGLAGGLMEVGYSRGFLMAVLLDVTFPTSELWLEKGMAFTVLPKPDVST